MTELFSLKGKTAVVIGGGGGIGLACARGFALAGANIVLADACEEYLTEAAEGLMKENIKPLCVPTDVSDALQVDRLLQKSGEHFSGVDIVVNSAAITMRKPILEISSDEWNRLMAVNLTGAFHVGQSAAKYMKNQNTGGKMIFVVSTGAYRAAENFGAYSASKAAVVMFMKTLALELARYKINVNAIAPTATNTRFTADYYEKNPDIKQAVIRNHPIGRIAEADDYVGTAIYLASAASDFTTGTLSVVDGGKTAK